MCQHTNNHDTLNHSEYVSSAQTTLISCHKQAHTKILKDFWHILVVSEYNIYSYYFPRTADFWKREKQF